MYLSVSGKLSKKPRLFPPPPPSFYHPQVLEEAVKTGGFHWIRSGAM